MKIVDTKEYVQVLRELVEEGREVSMVICGSSMSPFLIHQRDSIRFRKPDRPLRRGDMVFYQRDSGQYVMHRICRVRPAGYDLIGDAQTEIEGPIRRDQIFALVTAVRRKGRWIGPRQFWWVFFEEVWLCLIPLRPFLMKLYAALISHRTEHKKI